MFFLKEHSYNLTMNYNYVSSVNAKYANLVKL